MIQEIAFLAMKKTFPFVLLLTCFWVVPAGFSAEPSAEKKAAPLSEKAGPSAPEVQTASVSEPIPVVGTPYDKNVLTMLPGVPEVVSGQQVLPELKTYEELRQAISKARAASTTRIEKAVEQEKVREAWEIGRLIDEHVLQHKERADYGEKVLARLSEDLGMSHTELKYMLQFVRAYPICPPADQLSWAHYRELLSVNDIQERQAVAEQAKKESWSRDQLREEVKKRKAAKHEPQVIEKEASLTATPGKPGTYKTVKATVGPEAGKVVIDLGFSNYYRTSKELRFKEGAILEATPPFAGSGSAPSDLIRMSKRTSADLYTYRAWVVRVLDGDTLKVVVDMGFGVRSVQTLRLRGLDCPELVSKEGKEAKDFVEKLLAPSTQVLIKTIKSDKYDRYLADVFVQGKDGKQHYLNSQLLENGFAVQVSD